MSTPRTLQLGISELAVPSPRVGHIETYSGYGPVPDVGQEIHLKIQADRIREFPGYTPERWIQQTFTRDGYKFVVGGRMDGYIPGLLPRIEEIKSAYNVENLLEALRRNPEHPYYLQLRTYAYFHYLQTRQTAECNLLVVCARTGEETEVKVELDLSTYEAWLERRLKELVLEDQMFEKLKKRRKKSAKEFKFPFEEPRAGQRELMETVENGLGKGGRLLVQAPTGLGKTAAITLPVLRESMARGQKTIYVTAKNSQHAIAEDAAKRLQGTGAKVKAVTVHAKGKMCLKDEVFCNPATCEFARDYYTKVSASGLIDKLAKKKNLSAKTFKNAGREFEVCPFELQLDTLARADLVICDYNYVFSPRNAVGRLSNNGYGRNTPPNLIVDEAHNLPSRANSYFSAELSYPQLAEAAERADYLEYELRELLENLVRMVGRRIVDVVPEELRTSTCEIKLDLNDFSDVMGKSQELLGRYLGSNVVLRQQDPVLQICHSIGSFGEVLAGLTDRFFITYTPGVQGGVLKVTCCDASDWLKAQYANFSNTVAFSATIKPFEYYSKILGLDGDELTAAEFHSPFPRENRKLLIIPQISTKMRDRQSNYGKIKETIERIVQIKPGNYFVFFPSFDFLYQVAGRLSVPGFEVVCQQREMRREAVNDVLDRLRAQEKPMLIMAVQGGVFSEGIDYPGDMLIGALIVGPALPTFDFERELLRRYYDEKHGQGFDYAYTYPAMAKVIQSAGRVIRSSTDRGLIVLMDRRFVQDTYMKTMPSEWLSEDRSEMVSGRILNDIEEFWKSHEAE
jgi:DNA excision repair protein ERCC-2